MKGMPVARVMVNATQGLGCHPELEKELLAHI